MIAAVGFLTVFGGPRQPDDRTFLWFPLVGAAIGLALSGVWWSAEQLWSAPVAAAVVVAADLLITGMLHLDGLADSADGLLPHMDRERRLEVMRQPDTGAFALGLVPAVLLLRWSALLATDQIEPLSLVAIWAVSRTLIAAIPSLLPYARTTGLASDFIGGRGAWTLMALLPAVALAVAIDGLAGVAAVGVAVLAALLVIGLAQRRLGGFTGDVLGAVVIVTETAALLALAAAP